MKLHYPEGMKFHGENACKNLGFEKYNWQTDRDQPALFWLYTEDDYKYLALHSGKKYIFWNGSDVKWLMHFVQSDPQFAVRYAPLIRDSSIKHSCQNKILRDELALMGVTAGINPTFYGDAKKYKPAHPLTHDIYMTANEKRGFEYGEGVFNALSGEFPGWEFHIFGIEPTINTYRDNVRYYGWMPEDEMDEITKSFGICFRYNVHDGFSQTVMKALMRGQMAITTIGYGSLTKYCANYGMMIDAIQSFDEDDCESVGNVFFTNLGWLER